MPAGVSKVLTSSVEPVSRISFRCKNASHFQAPHCRRPATPIHRLLVWNITIRFRRDLFASCRKCPSKASSCDHTGSLPVCVHSTQAQDAPGDGRWRLSRCDATADWLGRGGRVDREPASVDLVLTVVPLAIPSLHGDRLDVPRRLFPGRVSLTPAKTRPYLRRVAYGSSLSCAGCSQHPRSGRYSLVCLHRYPRIGPSLLCVPASLLPFKNGGTAVVESFNHLSPVRIVDSDSRENVSCRRRSASCGRSPRTLSCLLRMKAALSWDTILSWTGATRQSKAACAQQNSQSTSHFH